MPKFGGIGNDEDDPSERRITKVTAVGTPKLLPSGDGVQQANEMTAKVELDN